MPTNKPPRVMVAWDANPEPDVAGYKVYHGLGSRFYDEVDTVTNVMTNGTVQVSSTNIILSGFIRGTNYYFAATAFNTSNLESDFSEEAVLFIPSIPSAPGGLETTNEVVVLVMAKIEEADDPAGPWETSRIYPTASFDSEMSSFFRVVMGIDLLDSLPE